MSGLDPVLALEVVWWPDWPRWGTKGEREAWNAEESLARTVDCPLCASEQGTPCSSVPHATKLREIGHRGAPRHAHQARIAKATRGVP